MITAGEMTGRFEQQLPIAKIYWPESDRRVEPALRAYTYNHHRRGGADRWPTDDEEGAIDAAANNGYEATGKTQGRRYGAKGQWITGPYETTPTRGLS